MPQNDISAQDITHRDGFSGSNGVRMRFMSSRNSLHRHFYLHTFARAYSVHRWKAIDLVFIAMDRE